MATYGASDWIKFAGLCLFVIWSAKQCFGYFTFSYEELVEDIKSSPLPLNAEGLRYFTDMIKTYADLGPIKKSVPIKFHSAVTTFIAVGLFVQFLKVVRQKAMNVHRWTGRVVIVVAILATPSFFSLIANQIEKQGAMYAEYPIAIAIPYFAIKGWMEIRAKDIQAHKASMIMFASCFFFFGLERMIMALCGPLHSGLLAKYMPLGDWQNWTYKDYDKFFNIIALISVPITFMPAVYIAYIQPYNALKKATAEAKSK